MRLITTNLTIKDVKSKLKNLVNLLFSRVPSGVGGKGFVNLNKKEFESVMVNGVEWCVENSLAWKSDLDAIESHGKIPGALPEKVSDKARKRGMKQLGTLGSGNHYLEIQVVEDKNIFDKEIAKQFGIFGEGQIVVMIHCGSRGFGHQIGIDYLKVFDEAMKKYNISVPDRELACIPFQSKEGQDYFGAMNCAANMAFANRQVITHRIRDVFSEVFKQSSENLEMNLVYDVSHNIAKIEEYKIQGKNKKVLVHRKGSTRSFPPGHEELWGKFKQTGQPVIIGGSMETGSYLLVGTQKAMDETFGSTCHGSGRTMSRKKAKTMVEGKQLQEDMQKRGIYVKTASYSGLAEEAGFAYKNVDEVINSVHGAGISKKIVKLIPIGNIKG